MWIESKFLRCQSGISNREVVARQHFSCLPLLLYVLSQKKVALYPSNSQTSVQSRIQVYVVQ